MLSFSCSHQKKNSFFFGHPTIPLLGESCVYASSLFLCFTLFFFLLKWKKVGILQQHTKKNGSCIVVDWYKVVCKQLQHTWRIATYKEIQNEPEQTKMIFVFILLLKEEPIDWYKHASIHMFKSPNSNVDSINFIWLKGSQQSNVYSDTAPNSFDRGEQNRDIIYPWFFFHLLHPRERQLWMRMDRNT